MAKTTSPFAVLARVGKTMVKSTRATKTIKSKRARYVPGEVSYHAVCAQTERVMREREG